MEVVTDIIKIIAMLVLMLIVLFMFDDNYSTDIVLISVGAIISFVITRPHFNIGKN